MPLTFTSQGKTQSTLSYFSYPRNWACFAIDSSALGRWLMKPRSIFCSIFESTKSVCFIFAYLETSASEHFLALKLKVVFYDFTQNIIAFVLPTKTNLTQKSSRNAKKLPSSLRPDRFGFIGKIFHHCAIFLGVICNPVQRG